MSRWRAWRPRWGSRRGGADAAAGPSTADSDPDAALAQRLPVGVWLAIWATLTLAFVLIARYAAFTQYQTGRFDEPGRVGDRDCLVAGVAAGGVLGAGVEPRFDPVSAHAAAAADTGSAAKRASGSCWPPCSRWGC